MEFLKGGTLLYVSMQINQVIPENDKNTSPANQKTAGSKLKRAR